MDCLYAPWRSSYLENFEDLPKGCVFCERPKLSADRDSGILYRDKSVFVIMNKYPYNSGHLMVIPYRHLSDPVQFSDEESVAIWKTVIECKKILDTVYRPHGFNIGMNVGRSAGAGIDGHSHLHIVPRWSGDTNFMPVIDGTKVLSEGLLQTYDRLKPCFEALQS